MSNHAHRRRGANLADPADLARRPGAFRRALRFVAWFVGPSREVDRFPKRGSATARMNAAVRAGYHGRTPRRR